MRRPMAREPGRAGSRLRSALQHGRQSQRLQPGHERNLDLLPLGPCVRSVSDQHARLAEPPSGSLALNSAQSGAPPGAMPTSASGTAWVRGGCLSPPQSRSAGSATGCPAARSRWQRGPTRGRATLVPRAAQSGQVVYSRQIVFDLASLGSNTACHWPSLVTCGALSERSEAVPVFGFRWGDEATPNHRRS